MTTTEPTTELVVAQPAPPRRTPVQDKITYAKALASSGMLPRQYQGNPANLLYAVEYAEMLGCHPLTAVTGVHVIDGKPSASAALISALVRKAGHRLRVTGDTKSATAQIIRADDPTFTFEVTFTMDDAKAAGLTGKGVWKNYPASMLKARAITQCARDACEDALSGLHYTAEELGAETDEDGVPVRAVQAQAVDVEWGPQADGDPWSLPVESPTAVTDTEWMAVWLAAVADATTKEVLQELWAEMVAKHKDLQLTDEDRADLTEQFKGAARALPQERPEKSPEVIEAEMEEARDAYESENPERAA